MKLLDTVVIIGSLSPSSALHENSMRHLNGVSSNPDMFVPMVSILEADLVMKARGYEFEERRSSWRALEYNIPVEKIIANSIFSINNALSLQEEGMDYFDSLITSIALEHRAAVVTTDRAIAKVVETEW